MDVPFVSRKRGPDSGILFGPRRNFPPSFQLPLGSALPGTSKRKVVRCLNADFAASGKLGPEKGLSITG